jgi:hypothetical protein
MILKIHLAVKPLLKLFCSGNLTHFYLEWRKLELHGTRCELHGKKIIRSALRPKITISHMPVRKGFNKSKGKSYKKYINPVVTTY